ncbi:MAG: hypothetical protein R3F34_05935 [Planctomycetota bacterium]
MHDTQDRARERIKAVVSGMFGQAFLDWGEMLGFEGSVGACTVRVLPHAPGLLERIVGDGLLVRTRLEIRGAGEPVLLVIPAVVLGTALANALMLPVEAGAKPSVDWDNAGHVDAIKELVNLFCGSASAALGKLGVRGRVSQTVDELSIHPGSCGDVELPGEGRVVCVQVATSVEGGQAHGWCLVGESMAASVAR